jgi:hypothetical protein
VPGGAETPRRALGEPGAGDEDGEAAAPGGPEEDGPQLGLYEDEKARCGGVEETPHRQGEVQGKGLEAGRRGKLPEPPPEKADAGRGGRGDEEGKRGAFGPKREDERVRQLDLADGDSLDPDVGPRRFLRRKEPAGDQGRNARRTRGLGRSPQPAFLEEVTILIREAALYGDAGRGLRVEGSGTGP